MAYTVTKLITNSYFLSGVLARELQTISGQQLSDGLDLLNAVIAIKSADQRLIPYYDELIFAGVPGQEKYFIDRLLSIETFTFNIGDVRFATIEVPRKTYFGSGRVDNINALPFSWHLERTLKGSNLYLYFKPDAAYVLKIWGQFSLQSVTLNQDLELTLDKFYIEYLRYALAEYICNEYNTTMQPQIMEKLKEYEAVIMDVSPPDLTLQKVSSLNGGPVLGWGFVNLSRGWIVP